MKSTKSALEHDTETLFFLHPVGFAAHVVHSSASGVRSSMDYFLCGGGPGAFSIKKPRQDTLCPTCVFVSGGICGSLGAFWYVQGANCQHTIFHARVGPVQI
jgi:hypothetical protein